MLDTAVILLRLLQYAGASALFGGALFALYGPLPREAKVAPGPVSAWVAPAFSAALVLVATILGLMAQTSVLAGSITSGLQWASLSATMTSMSLGPSSLIRACAATLALGLALALPKGRVLFAWMSLFGAVILGSFAWMGHGAVTHGSLRMWHLIADIVHALAAGAWLGALAALHALIQGSALRPDANRHLYEVLRRFSGAGSILVGLLVVSGIANGWFLLGPANLAELRATLYGQLFALKLLCFVAMLILAANNRFRLTPDMSTALDEGRPVAAVRDSLRRTVLLEAVAALVVLGLVSWLGRLDPHGPA